MSVLSPSSSLGLSRRASTLGVNVCELQLLIVPPQGSVLLGGPLPLLQPYTHLPGDTLLSNLNSHITVAGRSFVEEVNVSVLYFLLFAALLFFLFCPQVIRESSTHISYPLHLTVTSD